VRNQLSSLAALGLRQCSV